MSSDIEILPTRPPPARSALGRSASKSQQPTFILSSDPEEGPPSYGHHKSASAKGKGRQMDLDKDDYKSDSSLPDAFQAAAAVVGKSRPPTMERVPSFQGSATASTRSLVQPDSSEEDSDSDAKGPPTKKAKTAAAGKKADTGKKAATARTGKDGLTAAERKEAKAAEVAANKIRSGDNKLTSRKETLHELTIEISDALAEDKFFKRVLPSFKEMLKGDGGVKASSYRIFTPAAGIANAKLIRFLRTTNRYRDEQQKMWVRYPDGNHRSHLERTVFCFMSAPELDDIVAQGSGSLARFISSLKDGIGPEAHDIDFQFFLIVDGMRQFWRNEKNRDNRAFAAAVRGEDAPDTSKGKKTAGKVPAETIEEEMLRISVCERIFVVRTNGEADLARWIFELSMDISYRPYKLEERAHLELLGIDGTSKGGAKAGDYKATFTAQLAAMHMISDGQAENIVATYKTWRGLYEAYEECPTEKAKKELLVGIENGRLADGRSTAAKIGKGASLRIYTMLHSRDVDLPMDSFGNKK